MGGTQHMSVRGELPSAVIVGIAAAATIASLFIRWGVDGRYSLGPSLPWAYFISATIVGWVLSSPRVLPQRDGPAWQSRVFATAYAAIGAAATVTFMLNLMLLYRDGAQRDIHSMFINERVVFTLIGPLIYLVPLAIALPASLLVLVRDWHKALTVGAFIVLAFTLLLVVTELSAEFLLLSLKGR
jgi:hypothetical protein